MISQRMYQIPPVLALLALLLTGCDGNIKQEPEPVHVQWMRIQQQKPDAPPVIAGVVAPHIKSRLAFRVQGRIIKRNVQTGDVVHKGDILAETDATSLYLNVTSTEASLRNAEESLKNSAKNEKRKSILLSGGVLSKEEYDLAVQTVRVAQAEVRTQRANLAKARQQLGYTRLRAEYSGVVTAVMSEVGDTVSAGQTVFEVALLKQRDAVIDLSGINKNLLKGQPVFTISSQLDERLKTTGTLREVGPESDSVTRMNRIKIAIDDAPDAFRIGSVVNVRLLNNSELNPTICIPSDALVTSGSATSVWVISEGGVIHNRQVQLSRAKPVSGCVGITHGLKNNEIIIAQNASAFREGQQVMPVKKSSEDRE